MERSLIQNLEVIVNPSDIVEVDLEKIKGGGCTKTKCRRSGGNKVDEELNFLDAQDVIDIW